MKRIRLSAIVGLWLIASPIWLRTGDGAEKGEGQLPRGAVARLGDNRFKVSGNIESLAWSPDGRWIAAGISNGRGLYVWHATTGELHRKLPEVTSNEVAFTPDGTELHAQSQVWYRWKTDDWSALADGPWGDGAVQREWPFLRAHGWKYQRWYKPDDMVDIVDLASGDVLVRIPRKERIQVDIAQAAGVVAMYTGEANFHGGYVEVWDLAKKAKRFRFEQMTEHPGHFLITPDGQRLFAGGYVQPLRAWNLETGEHLGEVERSVSPGKLRMSPDGKQVLVASSEGPAALIDVATLKVAHRANLGGFPRGIAFSPDGAAIAIGVGNSVGIWDRRSGEFRRPGESATLPIDQLTALADGTVVASSNDETAVWNLADRKRLKTARRPGEGRLRVSPNGKWIAGTDRGGIVRVASVADADKLLVLPLTSSLEISATSTRDGQVLAWGNAGGLVEICALRPAPKTPPRSRTNVRAHTGRITGVALDADASRLASISGKSLKLWNADNGALIREWELDAEPAIVALSDDGDFIATTAGNKATVWAAAKAGAISHETLPGEITACAFQPKSSAVAACDRAGHVQMWNPTVEAKPRRRQFEGASLRCLDFSPDGELLAVAGENREVQVLRVDSLETKSTLAAKQPVIAVRFDGDGKRLLVATSQPSLQIWDVAAAERRRDYAGAHCATGAFAVDPNLLATYSRSRTFRMIDLREERLLGSAVMVPAAGAIGDCAFSPDGVLLAATTPVGVRLWRVATGDDVASLVGEAPYDHAVAFSADGQMLAAGGEGLAIWDVATQKPVANFAAGQAGEVHALQFSPDGLVLASSNRRGQVTLWDVVAQRPLLSIDTDGNATQQLSFTPDARVLIATSRERGVDRDPHVTAWDVVTGERLLRLADDGHVYATCLTPDGGQLLSGDQQGCVTVWDWAKLLDDALGPIEVDKTPIEKLWQQLSNADAVVVHRAVRALAARSEESLALVAKTSFAGGASDEQIAEWIRDLASDKPSLRRAASAGLSQAGEAAHAALKQALADEISELARERITLLLAARPAASGAGDAPPLRIIHVLESIGSPEAIAQLARIKKEANSPIAQGHAAAAIQRLKATRDN